MFTCECPARILHESSTRIWVYAYAWRRNWGSEVKAGGVPEAHSGSRRDSRSCRAAARRSRSLAGSVRCAPGSGRDRRTWRPLCTPSAPRSPKLCLQADRVRANISWNKAQQLLVNKQAIRLEVRNRSQRAIADEDKYSLKGCLKQWLSDCEILRPIEIRFKRVASAKTLCMIMQSETLASTFSNAKVSSQNSGSFGKLFSIALSDYHNLLYSYNFKGACENFNICITLSRLKKFCYWHCKSVIVLEREGGFLNLWKRSEKFTCHILILILRIHLTF